MDFKIQVGNPRIVEDFEDVIDNISDAIEYIYPLNTEYVILIWNYIPVLISYKYDISIMIEDILVMLSSIRLHNEGELKINWASNTFNSTWKLNWNNEEIQIHTEWFSVIGNTEELLNNNSDLRISRNDFCAEWKKLLENIINSLSSNTRKEYIDKVEDLVKEYESIKEYGIFYR